MASSCLILALLSVTFTLAFASDFNALQDFCIAAPKPEVQVNPIFVNGLFCKDPKMAQADDFSFSGLHKPGNASNRFGANVTAVNVAQIAGLNSLGLSMVRIDLAPGGVNPPHTHPRASEILVVLKGTVLAAFVTSNPGNRHIFKVLKKGDVFVFPEGLIHYQKNVGHGNAVAIASLKSQNPGVISIAGAVFGSEPSIPADVLTKSYQIDKNVVDFLQSQF